MANLSFRFLANDKGLKDGIKRSQKGLSGFEKTTKKVSGSISKALGGFGIALGASALISGLTNATKAAAEDLKQQKLLAGQLKRTTGATKAQVKGAENFIDTLSKQTGILDDDLRPALANAVRGSGSLEKGQKLLQIALDGSVASGKPLDTVLNALIKANNGNTQSLYKLAPELKKTKGGIDDYAKSVKGAAEAGADPFAKFNVAIENLSESFGALLLPYVEQFVTFLTEEVIPAVEDFIGDVSNPNTDVGKTFIAIKKAIVGEDGKSGVYGAMLLVVDAIGQLFGSLSSNGNALDGLVKAFEILAISLDVILFSIASIINQPLSGFADRVKKQIYGAAAINAVLSRESLFGTSYNGIAAAGQTGLSARVTEGITSSNNYTINVNKANMTAQEIIASVKAYERGTGRKYLANG
jgi:hypothetical protein